MKWTSITRHRAGTTFVLVFFLIFVVCSGLLALETVRVYRAIDTRAASTHVQAVPLEYLIGAARRADAQNGLALVTLNDDATTALQAQESGVNWLYYTKSGYLYKQNAAKNEATAERLCVAGVLRLRLVNGIIRADYTAPDGSRETLLLSPRAAGGAV